MTNHRSAITGEFVTAEYAEANPSTTVSEQRTRRPAGDYSDLRKLAEACPPEDDFNAIWYSEDRLEFAIGTRDRPFVAACSPTVVLGLLDELDRLRASLAEAVSTGLPIVRTVGDLTARHIGKRVRVGGGAGAIEGRLLNIEHDKRTTDVAIAVGVFLLVLTLTPRAES